jgi:hypothetical protein
MSSFKNDMQFLIQLGDTEMAFVIRSEVAEMYGVATEDIDVVVLSQIYGVDDK